VIINLFCIWFLLIFWIIFGTTTGLIIIISSRGKKHNLLAGKVWPIFVWYHAESHKFWQILLLFLLNLTLISILATLMLAILFSILLMSLVFFFRAMGSQVLFTFLLAFFGLFSIYCYKASTISRYKAVFLNRYKTALIISYSFFEVIQGLELFTGLPFYFTFGPFDVFDIRRFPKR
jgi:hypothetical protein